MFFPRAVLYTSADKELSEKEISSIIDRAVSTLGKIKLSTTAREWLISFANGDARQAISIIESTYGLYRKLTVASLKNALQSQHLRFDKKGEEHFNTISAFIKSMRASNADAAVYYLARMVEAGGGSSLYCSTYGHLCQWGYWSSSANRSSGC